MHAADTRILKCDMRNTFSVGVKLKASESLTGKGTAGMSDGVCGMTAPRGCVWGGGVAGWGGKEGGLSGSL